MSFNYIGNHSSIPYCKWQYDLPHATFSLALSWLRMSRPYALIVIILTANDGIKILDYWYSLYFYVILCTYVHLPVMLIVVQL